MPYQYDPNLDPNNPEAQGQGGNTQLAGGGQIVGGGSATAGNDSAGSGGGATAAAGAKPTQPSGFVNLNDYLKANEGSGFGSQFSQKLNDETSGAQDAQNKAYQNFSSLSNQGAVQPDSNLVKSATSDPTGFVSNSDNVAAFQKQRDAQYKGPYSLSDDQADYQVATGATQKAKDTAGAAQTEGGRFSLLNNYFGTPNYSQGQQSMDNLLLQGDPKAQQGIQQATQNANAAQQNYQQVLNQSNQLGAQNAGNTAAARGNARSALGIDDAGNPVAGAGAIGGLRSGIDARVAGMQKSQADNLPIYQNALNTGDYSKLTPEQKASLFSNVPTFDDASHTPFSPEYFKGLDSSKFFSPVQASQINPGSVATADEQARYAALSQLAGMNNAYLPDASLAGKMTNAPLYNFDPGALRNEYARVHPTQDPLNNGSLYPGDDPRQPGVRY